MFAESAFKRLVFEAVEHRSVPDGIVILFVPDDVGMFRDSTLKAVRADEADDIALC